VERDAHQPALAAAVDLEIERVALIDALLEVADRPGVLFEDQELLVLPRPEEDQRGGHASPLTTGSRRRLSGRIRVGVHDHGLGAGRGRPESAAQGEPTAASAEPQ
jgi:hypothetical protein